MKSKRRRSLPKRRHPVIQQQQPPMVFTFEALTVLQVAFQGMERLFMRSTHRTHPHFPFAVATFQQIQRKVAAMLLAPGEMMAFDENELLLIRTCLQIYTIDLLEMQATPERNRLLTLCQHITRLLPKVPLPPIQLHD